MLGLATHLVPGAPAKEVIPRARPTLTSPHSFRARASSSTSFCPPEARNSNGSQSFCSASRTNRKSAGRRSRA